MIKQSFVLLVYTNMENYYDEIHKIFENNWVKNSTRNWNFINHILNVISKEKMYYNNKFLSVELMID